MERIGRHGAWLGWSSLLLVASIAGVLVVRGSEDRQEAPRATDKIKDVGLAVKTRSKSRSGDTPAHLAIGLPFPVGLEQRYALYEQCRIVVPPGAAISELTLSGELTLTGLELDKNLRVRGQFDGDISIATNGDDDASRAALAEATRLPFVLEFAPDGTFLSGQGDPSLPTLVARTWSALGEQLQLVRSDAAKEWSRDESDANGTFTAHYEQADALRVIKHREGYHRLNDNLFDSVSIDSSDISFETNDRGELVSLDLAELTQTHPGQNAPVPPMASTVKVSLQRTSAVALSGLKALLAEASRAQPLKQIEEQEDSDAIDREMIGSWTFADAFRRVRVLSKENATSAERDEAGRAYLALAAMIRRDPKALETARNHLRKKGAQSTVLFGALRDASTAESQALLAEMAAEESSPFEPELRMEAARALSHVQQPTAETVRRLERLQSDPEIGLQGTYGLGSTLHRLKEQDPTLASTVRDMLTNQLNSASTPGERAAVLTALGNAGDSTTLKQILPFADASSELERAAAAQAVRRITSSDVESLLANACADSSALVRSSAVDAIHERAPALALSAALQDVVINEPEFSTRAQALRVLVEWLPKIPTVSETLSLVAQNDVNADLRSMAANALNNGT